MPLYTGVGAVIGLVATGLGTASYLILRFTQDGCQTPELQQDFDIAKYMGTWYEFEKTKNPF